MRCCAISIDVDSIACYYRIHGLGPMPAHFGDLVMRRCVPRFAEILERRRLRATFFIVARDIDPHAAALPDLGPAVSAGAARAAGKLVAELSAAGHEIGNHSYSHPYDLARLPDAQVGAELARAHALLGEIVGRSIIGFRAPGYDLSPTVLGHLMRLGYHYDSSVFPAPGYYAAKLAVMGAMALIGRTSGAVLTDPRALLARIDPYRPAVGAPWRRGQASVVELPIAVTSKSRIPVIGTSLLLAPRWLRDRMLDAMARRKFFNFELHAIDLADADSDGLPDALVARQPDLRVPLAQKQRRFEAILDRLDRDFDICPLADVAATVQRYE